MSGLVEYEGALLKEFAQRTCDLRQDQTTLIRFLRAREYNLNKAEEMLRNAIKWREQHNIKAIKNWSPPPAIKADFLFKFTGYDDENRPVLVIPYGRWSVRKMIEKNLRQESLRAVHQLLELILEHISESGQHQFVVILDSEGMTFRKVAHLETIETAIQVFKDFEQYFPETLNKCFVINSPFVFPWVFSFIKPLLSVKTLAKVQFFDSNKAKWQESLLRHIPAESLPENYGGTAEPFDFGDTE